jgi:WXG100 family type VII secretion target
MTLQADLPALDALSRRIDAVREEIVADQASLGREVDQLLAARWSGAAAAQFREAWLQWRRGLADLMAGVRLEGDAIELTRVELARTDEDRDAAARRLRERLDA